MTPENEAHGSQDFVCQESQVPRGGSGGSTGFSPAALRRHMQRTGYTVEEVADQIGLTRQAVSAWLTGRTTPSPRSLTQVAEVLEVTPADLTPGIGAQAVTLQDMRTRAGLSQSAVARQLGLLQSLLSDIERGRRDLNDDIVQRLADLYGLPHDEIVDAWESAIEHRRKQLSARRKRDR